MQQPLNIINGDGGGGEQFAAGEYKLRRNPGRLTFRFDLEVRGVWLIRTLRGRDPRRAEKPLFDRPQALPDLTCQVRQATGTLQCMNPPGSNNDKNGSNNGQLQELRSARNLQILPFVAVFLDHHYLLILI